MIVDASVILSAFFADEEQAQAQALIRDHVIGQLRLAAPGLLVYEVTNAVLQARRRGRIDDGQVEEILAAFEGLGIELRAVGWRQILPLARAFDRSAYDAAYLALADAADEPLITADARLYQAVRGRLPWVRWIGEYGTTP